MSREEILQAIIDAEGVCLSLGEDTAGNPSVRGLLYFHRLVLELAMKEMREAAKF